MMPKCSRCGKRGLFLRLYHSLCNDCLEELHNQEKKSKQNASHGSSFSKPSVTEYSPVFIAEQLMRSIALGGSVHPNLQSTIDQIRRECGSQGKIAARAADLIAEPSTSREYSIKSLACEWAGASYRQETIKWTLKWIETECEDSLDDSSWYPGCTPQQSRLATGYERLAKAYEGEYMFEEALAAYQKAWKIRTNAYHYINMIARVYTKMNRIDDAIALLKNTPLIEGELKQSRNEHLKELKEKKAKGYVYKPRKKQ